MDYLSLKAAVEEAGNKLTGLKIADAWQSNPREVVIKTHHGPGLIFSIDPVRPGLYLFDPDALPGRQSSSFSDLLRARVKGTTVAALRMPEAGERIVFITVTAAWPAKESKPLTIVAEVMGRRSNLMLLEEGRILQPLKVVPKDKSPARPVVAGQAYIPPPPRKGLPLEEVTAAELTCVDVETGAGSLLEVVRGLSPYLARQAFGISVPGRSEVEIKESLAGTLEEMAASCTGEAGFVHHSGGKIHLAPFEPLFLETSDIVDRYSPFSEAAKAWRVSGSTQPEEGGSETAFLEAGLRERKYRVKSSLEHLNGEEERCRSHNEVRVMAETLLIHVTEISPGAGSVTFPDPYDPGLQLTIPVNPNKNPQENANDLFNQARRLKRGLEEVTSRRDSLEKEMADIRDAGEALNLREDPEPARKLLGIRSSGTLKKGKHPQAAYTGPGRQYTVDDFTILVGKSATDNEKVTFKAAGPNDMWLHARDYPGSHVVVLTERRPVPDEVLYKAADLAAAGSRARNDTAPEIMVTERKWVKKLKGGKPGQVTVERYRTVRPRAGRPKTRAQGPKKKH